MPSASDLPPKPPRSALRRRTLFGTALVGPPISPQPLGGDEHADRAIFALCRQARRLEMSAALNDAVWDSTVRQLSALPAQTQAGLHAKAQLLRSFVPGSPAERRRDRRSPDEQLLGSVLDDLLGPSALDKADPEKGRPDRLAPCHNKGVLPGAELMPALRRISDIQVFGQMS